MSTGSFMGMRVKGADKSAGVHIELWNSGA
jgi:hypothetical protein